MERAGVVSKGWFRKGYILDGGMNFSIGLQGVEEMEGGVE